MGEALSKRRQEILNVIAGFRLMDDDFMSAVFQDNMECAALTLQIILGKPDLAVTRVVAQHKLTNLQKRSIRLDVHAFGEGKEYDIESQRADQGDSARRARYNLSIMDANSLIAGEDFDKLPEIYVIFITENDVVGKGKPVYFFQRRDEDGILLNDGSAIVYVNGAYSDVSTPLGKLVHDFQCTNAGDMYYDVLKNRVRYFKENPEGVSRMCKAMEELHDKWSKEAEEYGRSEERLQNIRNLMKNAKVTAEKAMEMIGLDAEARKKYLALL